MEIRIRVYHICITGTCLVLAGLFLNACEPESERITCSQDSAFAPAASIKPGFSVAGHRISPAHPSAPTHPHHQPESRCLFQVLNAQGVPVDYYMTVESVACQESLCAIDKVRMHWDALGHYRGYDLPAGVELTKRDHVPFSKADYAKLEAILNDRQSLLRDSDMGVLTTSIESGPIAGITGATVIANKKAIVAGAAYTSYHLWHWANGSMTGIIRDLTEQQCNTATLRHFLAGNNRHYHLFALDHLRTQSVHSPEMIQAAAKLLDNNDNRATDKALDYLQQATDRPQFYNILTDAFIATNSKKRIHLLKFLTTQEDIPTEVYDKLTGSIPTMSEYYEAHLLLNLLERDSYTTNEILRKVAALLDNNNFFVARRAYWYLQRQQTNPTIKTKIQQFAQKNQNRLLN